MHSEKKTSPFFIFLYRVTSDENHRSWSDSYARAFLAPPSSS
jgi:hypothetical protein